MTVRPGARLLVQIADSMSLLHVRSYLDWTLSHGNHGTLDPMLPALLGAKQGKKTGWCLMIHIADMLLLSNVQTPPGFFFRIRNQRHFANRYLRGSDFVMYSDERAQMWPPAVYLKIFLVNSDSVKTLASSEYLCVDSYFFCRMIVWESLLNARCSDVILGWKIMSMALSFKIFLVNVDILNISGCRSCLLTSWFCFYVVGGLGDDETIDAMNEWMIKLFEMSAILWFLVPRYRSVPF